MRAPSSVSMAPEEASARGATARRARADPFARRARAGDRRRGATKDVDAADIAWAGMLAKPRWSADDSGGRACGDARRDLAWKSETCRLSKSRRYKQESFSPSRIVPIRTPRHSLRAHASRRRRRDGHRLRARASRRCQRAARRATLCRSRGRRAQRVARHATTGSMARICRRARRPLRGRRRLPRRRAEGVVRRARVRDRRHRGGVRGGALRAGGARGRERADGARAERFHRKSAQLRGRPLVRIRARRGTRRRRGVRASRGVRGGRPRRCLAARYLPAQSHGGHMPLAARPEAAERLAVQGAAAQRVPRVEGGRQQRRRAQAVTRKERTSSVGIRSVRIAPFNTLAQTRHRRSLAAIARTPQLFIPAGFPSSAAPRSPR